MQHLSVPQLRVLGAILGLAVFPVLASDPASQDVTVPSVGGEPVVVEWTGTALPGVSGITNACIAGGPDDSHDINLTVPEGLGADARINLDFHIEWDAGTTVGIVTDPDLVLSVARDGTVLGSSDGSAPEENVSVVNPESGTYTAIACPYFASGPTAYRGRLTITLQAAAACVEAPSKALAHSTATSSFGGLKDQEASRLINFDRFRNNTGSTLYDVPDGLQGRRQTPLFDRNLGKLTFLWARDSAQPVAVGALSERELLIARARAQLLDEAKRLGLTPTMIDEAEVVDAQFNGNGPAVVRFRQRINGLEVYHRSLNVLLDRSYTPVAVSGYFATRYEPSVAKAATFAFSAPQAIASAWTSIGGVLDASLLTRTAVNGLYELYSMPVLQGSHAFERAPRIKPVYYERADGRVDPAYYVELFSRAKATGQLSAYSFIVSASDRSILHRTNLVADAAFTYRVFADDAGINQPYDAPLGNGYTPFPGSTPDAPIARVGAEAKLVTLEHAGIVTGDPWLADEATITTGNHVDACIDNIDLPSVGLALPPPINSCIPQLELRAETTGDHTFDYPAVADEDPSTDAAKNAAVVNLFYMNNWLHDWWYNHGFDEVSGNAQTDNYGRGGSEGDPILAQGQDGSGRNNANMATPADGSSPVMQQYLFDGLLVGEVRQTAPIESGPLKFAAASFGATAYDLTGAVVLADEGAGDSSSDGCGFPLPDPGLPVPLPTIPAPPQVSLAGNIALIDRGSCNFTTKALFAELSGAVAMIVVNNTDGDPIPMGNGDLPISTGSSPTDVLYQIPAIMITKADGEALKAQLANGDAVSVRMQREESIDIDGTLDNQIIAHEYFHYVHHRLTDSSNQQAGAMSEGWGDISAFMLSTRPDDTAIPGNDTFQGAYGLAWYVSNNFFAGIRRAPYSTDFEKNAFTFKHISDGEPTPDGGPGTSNSEVHNAGEIWANAVWECYAGILNRPELSFEEARSHMQDYIIGGMKMTPADATYTEARDAILSVVLASDYDDYAACSLGFAKRGMGLNAVSPSRSSSDLVGVVEDYTEFVCDKSDVGGGGSDGGKPDLGRFGGALGWPLLLPLLGLALLRRRRV
ncbi:hypothetical protein E4T66_14670 [Sinimarinibacterium sp. CAU 1509]|uniref:M36 family metallopeptidase n=1 Tax=Sinimarinibacterium sp. CAU 1509 TaxID=2562283 RepID=UPI0010ACC780|nr:M36 family metallopeptidase [Sinimarinibacterium sp. CAU 1509]TJY58842.1 hypothetical protein E4T66_14670 [Sinimarinibacterium sp. CAU 1509]